MPVYNHEPGPHFTVYICHLCDDMWTMVTDIVTTERCIDCDAEVEPSQWSKDVSGVEDDHSRTINDANELVFGAPARHLDFKRPHHMLGPDKQGADYGWQDGWIYAWSNSNLTYEYCWWLDALGDPINGSEHVTNLLRDRPFDKQWLRDAGVL